MKRFRYYLRIFLVGFIFAALVLGSVALKATHPQTPDRQKCQPSKIEKCQPSKIESCQPIQPSCPKPYYQPIYPGCPNGSGFDPKETPVRPKTRIPCPLQKEG